MPEEVRIYAASGVPHAPFRPLTKPVMQLPGNPLGYGAFMRALLVALFEWVEHGTAPPDSRFPSREARTLAPLAEAQRIFPRLPGVNFPKVLNELRQAQRLESLDLVWNGTKHRADRALLVKEVRTKSR